MEGPVPLAIRDFHGTGPDVLLLHGAGRNLADWSLVAPLLGDRFRRVAVDLRCHGASGDGEWTWEAVLGDLQCVIEQLALDRPAVVGHSMGGMVAARWAAAHPECTAAVNLDGHGLGRLDLCEGMDPQEARRRGAQLRQHHQLRAAQAPTTLTLPQAQALIEDQQRSLSDYHVDPVVVEQVVRRGLLEGDDGWVRRPGPEVTAELARAIDDQDLLGVYGAALCPLLVVEVTGPDSVPAAEPGQEWIASLLSAYRRGLTQALAQVPQQNPLVEVQQLEATHGMILTHPQQTAALLRHYLDGR